MNALPNMRLKLAGALVLGSRCVVPSRARDFVHHLLR